MAIVYVIVGLILLVASGEGLVNGAVRIAEKFHISPLVLGMTVVAFGTSAPELIVSLGSAVSGQPDLALGNVIGSNISNIALVLAMSALILPIPVISKRLLSDWLWMLGSSVLFLVFAFNNIITHYEGAILFALLITFIVSSIRAVRKSSPTKSENQKADENKTWFSLLLVVASSGGLAYGANLLIEGASEIARGLGVSERVIGITLVAFGTSLPELATSCMAAIKKQTDISIGNIIGSNIFNVLAVIGITSIFKKLPLNISEYSIDFITMLLISVMLLIFIMPLTKNLINYRITKKTSVLFSLNNARMGRLGGVVFLVIYVAYVVRLFIVQ